MTQAVDEAKLEQFMGQMVGYMTGGAMCFGVWLGDELGLYGVLSDIGPATADEVAGKAGCNPRLVREWLDGQVAGGLVLWDAARDRYELSPEAAMALADDSSPAFVARAMNAFGSMFIDMTKIAQAFRGDGGLAWGDHHPCLFSGTEWFFRTGYRAELPNWIGALDGVEKKLAAGATRSASPATHSSISPTTARCSWSSRMRSTDGPTTSLATRWRPCCTRRPPRSALPTRSPRRSASVSVPRQARPGCGRCSPRPVTRSSAAQRGIVGRPRRERLESASGRS
jgi:hypothetical protein